MSVVLQAVVKSYGDLSILRGVELEVPPASSLAVVGPSGCGKSTLLSCLTGLEGIDDGSITIDDKRVDQLDESSLARWRNRHCGVVFQQYRLLPTLSAVENVQIPLELAGERNSDVKAREWLESVGLADRAHHLPSRLSGGEQQRVAIARALIAEPVLVLADEPTGNLDRETGDRIAELLFKLVQDRGATLITVTHDPAFAALADRQVTLVDGKVVDVSA